MVHRFSLGGEMAKDKTFISTLFEFTNSSLITQPREKISQMMSMTKKGIRVQSNLLISHLNNLSELWTFGGNSLVKFPLK